MTRSFWLDLAERAGKTFAQALLACFAAGVTIAHLNWGGALDISGTAALLSVLSSLGSLPIGGNGTASLVRAIRHGRHEAPPN